MPRIGSDQGFVSGNTGGLFDDDGNAIVSSDTSFAASPLGVAARTQALYGIPNANFNITPLQPSSPIVDNSNPLPYWSVNDLSNGVITATSVFDSATQTYGVQINPGTAASGASYTLTTRSYLITDDNLALRQKAQAVLSKSGTAAGTTQWYLTLNAVYYSAADTALSTAVIGTVFDTGTWTSLAGTTTPGGSAINAAAQYVDLTFTLTTTAAVTGSAKPTIKSLLLTTSTPTAGGGFLITETFTSSGTWTRPTGVDYLVAVIGIGAGGGGGAGELDIAPTTSNNANGGGGGGAGAYRIERDLYVGNVASVSVGIGTGGAGGTATTASKPAAGTLSYNQNGGNGSDGGVTTFGAYFTADRGRGGTGGNSSAGGAAGGARGNNTTSTVYGGTTVLGGAGGVGAEGGSNAAGTGIAGGFGNFDQIPYNAPSPASGAAGGVGSGSGGAGGSVWIGTAIAGGTAGYISGGGGGGGVSGTNTATFWAAGASQKGGGGSGGTGVWGKLTTTTTMTATAGSGGAGGSNVGSGGGGGGGVAVATSTTVVYNASTVTATSGAGGAGSNGSVTVVYIA